MYNKNFAALSDCHMHCDFSSDSKASAESMIESAIKLGLKTICFTDHNDYDYPLEDGKVMFSLDLPAYKEKIRKLGQKYSDRIEVLCGVEQGLMKSVADRVNAYPTKDLDVVIGSSHMVNGEDPYYEEFWKDKKVVDVINLYYESILENLESCNNFDVYGHIDYVARYIPPYMPKYNEADYYEIIDAILKKIISKDKGIEINMAGFKYGMGNPNPSPWILKRYKELGGEILTLGSDAHKPEHIAYDYQRLPQILADAGFSYYTVFKERKAEFRKWQI